MQFRFINVLDNSRKSKIRTQQYGYVCIASLLAFSKRNLVVYPKGYFKKKTSSSLILRCAWHVNAWYHNMRDYEQHNDATTSTIMVNCVFIREEIWHRFVMKNTSRMASIQKGKIKVLKKRLQSSFTGTKMLKSIESIASPSETLLSWSSFWAACAYRHDNANKIISWMKSGHDKLYGRELSKELSNGGHGLQWQFIVSVESLVYKSFSGEISVNISDLDQWDGQPKYCRCPWPKPQKPSCCKLLWSMRQISAVEFWFIFI